MAFVITRDRDAWFVLRGYVYQIHRTIQVWLELGPEELLVLECGEDIDTIDNVLDATSTRTLEQVKHRQKRISLRSAEALEALANFVEHRAANPSALLRFRFLTNAKAAREQLSKMPGRRPGIAAWEELRQSARIDDANRAILNGIKDVLAASKRPPSVSLQTWERLQQQVSSDASLQELIRLFEWSVSVGGARDIEEELRAELVRRGASPERAQQQYERLFLHVIQLLTITGPKQLRSADLHEPLALNSLDRDRSQLLERIRVSLDSLRTDVNSHRARLDVHEQKLQIMNDKVASAVAQFSNASLVLPMGFRLNTNPPERLQKAAARAALSHRIARLVTETAWVAINAGSGMGKTEMALTVVDLIQRTPIWLRLRERQSEDAGMVLIAALSEVTGLAPKSNRHDWYIRVTSNLGHAVIILDDLPRLEKNAFSDELGLLAEVCQTSQTRLLSTSVHPIPMSLIERSGAGTIERIELPVFQYEETLELFHSYGAPLDWLTRKRAEFLLGIARGHPTLLVAAIRFVQRRDWKWGEDELNALLKRDHELEVVHDTVRALKRTVEDPDTLNLVHRLSLFPIPFGWREVEATARISPAIDRVRERLGDLRGLWVQSDSTEGFTVSPLIRDLGRSELPDTLRRAVHGLVALRIPAQGPMGPHQVLLSVQNFVEAKAFDQAALMLGAALHEMPSRILQGSAVLLHLWADADIPVEVSLPCRIYLRSAQARALTRAGENVDYIVADLSRLARRAESADAWSLAVVVAIAGGTVAEKNFDEACAQYLKAISFIPAMRLPDGKALSIPIEGWIWSLSSFANSRRKLDVWIETLKQLSSLMDSAALLNDELYVVTAQGVSDQLWLEEARKPAGQRDWDTVFGAICHLADVARAIGFELIWACAKRALAVIEAEYKMNGAEAERIIVEALATASTAPGVQFILNEVLGRHYLLTGNADGARQLLGTALASGWNDLPITRINTLLCASRSWDGVAEEPVRSYALEAVALGRHLPRGGESELIKALAELSMVEWRFGDKRASFDAISEAVALWFLHRDRMQGASALFVLLSSATSYFTSLAVRGSLPEREDGLEPNIPTPGMFTQPDPDDRRAGLYVRANDSFVMRLLSDFAEHVGAEEVAADWAIRAVDDARSQGQHTTILVSALGFIRHALREGRVADALDIALEAGKIAVAGADYKDAKNSLLPPNSDIDALVQGRTDEAEDMALKLVFVPLAFRLGVLYINDKSSYATEASQAVQIFRDLAARCTLHEAWRTAADLIEMACILSAPCREIAIKAVSLANRRGNDALHVGGYILAGISDKASLQDALRCQHSITSALKTDPKLYRYHALPFLTAFWQDAVTNRRFMFNAPRLLDLMWAAAIAASLDERAALILSAVAAGLLVTLK